MLNHIPRSPLKQNQTGIVEVGVFITRKRLTKVLSLVKISVLLRYRNTPSEANIFSADKAIHKHVLSLTVHTYSCFSSFFGKKNLLSQDSLGTVPHVNLESKKLKAISHRTF